MELEKSLSWEVRKIFEKQESKNVKKYFANDYLSGAIYVKEGKRIPFINTALPRVNQYFTAWHELYHIIFDTVSFDHLIEAETTLEERKAEYFASKMLLGNLMPYYMELPKDMELRSKVYNCMSVFQTPYKSVLIALYEAAVQTDNRVASFCDFTLETPGFLKNLPKELIPAAVNYMAAVGRYLIGKME